MTILVRRARIEELDQLVSFQMAMAKETERMQLDPFAVKQGVAAVLDNPALGDYWAVEYEGRLAACLMTLYEWSDWRARRVMWIHSVYVQAEYRRKGLFRAAYQHLQQFVQQSPDLAGLRLYVDKRNDVAQKTYEELGMNAEHYILYEWLK